MAALRQPASGLDSGRRGAAPDELRRQTAAAGVRRDALEAERGGQNLDAAVDLVWAERDDAVGRGGRRRRAQLVDDAGDGADEVLAAAAGDLPSCGRPGRFRALSRRSRGGRRVGFRRKGP